MLLDKEQNPTQKIFVASVQYFENVVDAIQKS